MKTNIPFSPALAICLKYQYSYFYLRIISSRILYVYICWSVYALLVVSGAIQF